MRSRRALLGLITLAVILFSTIPLLPHEERRTASADVNLEVPNDLAPQGPDRLTETEGLTTITARGRTFDVAPGHSGRTGPGDLLTYRVEVQKGIKGITAESFAAEVEDRLMDHRSWGNTDGRALQRVSTRDADFAVTLAKPKTVDRLCYPLTTGGFVSCNMDGRAVINLLRWTDGAPDFPTLERYRSYLINHEVGHGFGKGHDYCPAPGKPGTLMMQQTYTWRNECTPQEWPAPKAAKFTVQCVLAVVRGDGQLTLSGRLDHTSTEQDISLTHRFKDVQSELGTIRTTTDGAFSVSLTEAGPTATRGEFEVSFVGDDDRKGCTAVAPIESN